MSAPKNWEKEVDNQKYHTGGQIYADMQRWVHNSGNFVVEATTAPKGDELKQGVGGDIQIFYSGNDKYYPLTSVKYVDEEDIEGNFNRTNVRAKLREVANKWMKEHTNPDKDKIEEEGL